MTTAWLGKQRPVARFGGETAAVDAAVNPALPQDSHISLVTTLDELAGLEAGWRKLELTAASPHAVFQTFDWIRSWARAYAGPGTELCIITGYRGDDLAFVWPLMKVSYGPLKILRWASEPLGQYGDVLLAKGEHSKVWLDAAFKFLHRLRNIDAIRLRHVRADATSAPFLREAFRDANHADQAPWLDLTAFANEAAYDARYNSNQRKRRKKIRKSLEDKFGPVRFEVLGPGIENDAAMRDAVAEKCKWIDDRGRQNRILKSCQLNGFLKDLSRVRNGSAKLVTSRMTAGSTVVSWEIGLRFGASHFGFITSHITSLTDYSPARLHMDFSQRQALADGMTVFDLMVPNDAHKDSWSSAAMETHDYHASLSPLGWIYGRLYLEFSRPFLRNAYYRLPPAILRLLKPLTGH